MQLLSLIYLFFFWTNPSPERMGNLPKKVNFRHDSIPVTEEINSFDINFVPNLIPEKRFGEIFNEYPQYIADGFDFPVGYPDAKLYYNAQKFGSSRHLGEDWNATTGGNSDLGDPVFAISNGLVTFAEEICCGWGNVVRVIHHTPYDSKQKYVESVYAHLRDIDVTVGHLVLRGQMIGTIGTANGIYPAHLHFEMRDFINMPIGLGYSDAKYGYLHPTNYINLHRPRK